MHDLGLLNQEPIKREIRVISVRQRSKAVRDIHLPSRTLKRSCLSSHSVYNTISLSKDMRYHNTHISSFPDSFRPFISRIARNLANAHVEEINNIHGIRFNPNIGPIEFRSLINGSDESKHLSFKSKTYT